MKALALNPSVAGSIALREIDRPNVAEGSTLVRAVALGICGTDREIVGGAFGAAPDGQPFLVLGHESLGVVEEAPRGSAIRAGDHVVPFVRVPDPIPCDCCAAGHWDRCRNGLFAEHGVKKRHGFGREYYRVDADHLIAVDSSLGLSAVLAEPASVVAKAWMEIDRLRDGECGPARRVLITGAGPIGLLAALLGAQRGLDIHLFDRATTGPKPALARRLGAGYHSNDLATLPDDFDIVLECTGAPAVTGQVARHTAPNGVVCLLGITGSARAGSGSADLNDTLVLGNRIVFGSVNANRRHYEAAHDALRAAPPGLLDALITRRVPLADWREAFTQRPDDVKTVILFE